MPDRRFSAALLALFVATSFVACNSSKQSKAPNANDSATKAAAVIPAPGSPDCPATGLWAQCSVMYRLERGGIAPHRDSTDAIEEKALAGKAFAVKFGINSRLEVFLYPDSTARIADGKKLDRTKLVNAQATQTINRERTLIENGNLIALLTSLNDRLRERVSDALTAGAPQPSTPPVVK